MKKIRITALIILCFAAVASVVVKLNITKIQKLLCSPKSIVVKSDEERFVRIKKGDCLIFGSMYSEPIEWRVVLVGDETLLFSDKVITFRRFSDPKTSGAMDYGAYGSSEWKNSEIRHWLNSDAGFLSFENFTIEEKHCIFERGKDIVTLPDKTFFRGMRKEEIVRLATPQALLNCKSAYLNFPRKPVWYWTQTPAPSNRISVVTVTPQGGFYKSAANDELCGICPMLRLRGNEFNVTSGSGTPSAPYVIKAGGAK